MRPRRRVTPTPRKQIYTPDSPSRTPTTLTSLSFSSQDFLATSSSRLTPISARCSTEPMEANSVKDFHARYLEFGLWPIMSQTDVGELKSKYRDERVKREMMEGEVGRLKSELQSVGMQPCLNCEKERERHNSTKRALEEAIALSNLLLREVSNLDSALTQKQCESYRSSIVTSKVLHKH